MRILLVHNYYQHPGGEGRVFEEEARLLKARGHDVFCYTAHNDDVEQMSRPALAGATLWNGSTYRALRDQIRRERPEVVHVHNTLPLISPAVYYAAQKEGLPVVKTLHNYRLMCPNGLFLREGRPCEDCLGKSVAWPGVLHACYRDSRTASGAVAAMLAVHRGLSTWTRRIDRYIALTTFARRKFIEGGLPPEKIQLKPHFVHPDPGVGRDAGGYALYVGRLSVEKGVRTLLAAWKDLPQDRSRPAMLKIVGEGPLDEEVGAAERELSQVEWLGRRPPEAVSPLMSDAAVVIVPSECYETFGRVIMEAFAVGTPVLAADIGAIAELVTPGRTGRLFRPGDPEDLAAEAEKMLARPSMLEPMREAARVEYEKKYTAARNYEMLMDVYETVSRRASP